MTLKKGVKTKGESRGGAAAVLKPRPRKREARGSARRELIAIQKRIWKRLHREIQSSLDEPSGNVQIYLEEYERELALPSTPVTRDDLLASALSADLVYVGDYHTLRTSQMTLVNLLHAAARAREEVILGIELVHARDQEALDRYMAGELTDEQFHEAIRYEETWGFEWKNYREIFQVARKRKVRVVGINSDPPGHARDHLLERDFRAAEVVVRETLAHPRALVLVQDGDLHVAKDHLPLLVDSLLERSGKKREKTVIHQNAEAIYWRLAKKRLEQSVSIVRLDENTFCVLNASPIEKLQSYLNWQSERDELEPENDSDWEEIVADEDEAFSTGADATDQVLGLVTTLARFLQIERDDLDDFELFTFKDLDLLDDLAKRFSKDELEDLKRQVASSESYFIPRGNIIYLADLSVSNAAEEAAHFLHWKCSGMGEAPPRDRFFDFYLRTITEALGFFGSKVLNHKRECWREADCEQYVARRGHGRGLTAEQRFQLLACALVLKHKRMEKRFLESGKRRRLPALYEQPSDLHLRITHTLGHMLGEKLYLLVVDGRIEKAFVRELFHEKHATGSSAMKRYLELVALTQNVSTVEPGLR